MFTAPLLRNKSGADQRKHRSSIVAGVRFREKVFTEPLPSNESFGFQVSCHNINTNLQNNFLVRGNDFME
jgi:hypothetical protein